MKKKKFKIKILKLEDKEIYNDIPFDVIKRGPLLLLLIGLSFSWIIFVMEFIVYFKYN